MDSFDKVIGYEEIKTELRQICDMFRNRDKYTKLGASIPGGILFYGQPGIGKTLLANTIIEEAGVQSFVLRRDRNDDSFIDEITQTFKKAAENAPAIILLDDMDKFSNSDERFRDTPEYVAIQSGMDSVHGKDVLVIGTVNWIEKLPHSLRRDGRFDLKVFMDNLNRSETGELIKHFFKDKKISDDVSMDDLIKMLSYTNCARMESIINQASIYAAYDNRDSVNMKDLIDAVLRKVYKAPNHEFRAERDENKVRKNAVHEAGHVLISEYLRKNSVGFASVSNSDGTVAGGVVKRCKEFDKTLDEVYVCLAGKAAVELLCEDDYAEGCESDFDRAYRIIEGEIAYQGARGITLLNCNRHGDGPSAEQARNIEKTVLSEMEMYFEKTKQILKFYLPLLNKLADELVEKRTLLFSDIKRIEDEVGFVDKNAS